MEDAPRSIPPPSRSTSQTMSRGIRIMEILDDADAPLSAAELAGALQVERAVVHRLLRTLAAHHRVWYAQEGRFTPEVGLLALSGGVYRHLRDIALPHLLSLAETTRSTAFIGVRRGRDGMRRRCGAVGCDRVGALPARACGARCPGAPPPTPSGRACPPGPTSRRRSAVPL